MESPNSFSAARLKRKCEDSDYVVELLHSVSLSPHSKKIRQDFCSTSFSKDIPDLSHLHTGFGGPSPPDLQLSDQVPENFPDVNLSDQLPDPLPICPANDERAIVLYKPVNPPLFPGGPSAGSQIMLNASIFSTGMLDASSLLTGRDDQLPWLRASTNSSGVSDDMEESGSNPDNKLAVVPWVSTSNSPKFPMNILPVADTHAAEQATCQDVDDTSGEDLDIEAMEEDTELGMEVVNSQLNSSSINYRYEPWQHSGVPQPQYSSIMWSH